MFYAYCDTPLGQLLATSQAGRIHSVQFVCPDEAIHAVDTTAPEEDKLLLTQCLRLLKDYLSAPSTALYEQLLTLPLALQGTPFQERVWHALRELAVGEVISYTNLAQRIQAPKAVRAVAQACAANRHAIIIPCHRIVRHDGSLSGYRWGVERKQQLLTLERSVQEGN